MMGMLAGGIMNRVARGVAAMSMRFHVAMANAWRDNYNPLRGLTIARAVSMLEDGERGAFAQLQWTYRFIEMQDATLGALVERRTSAVQKMGWDVKIREGLQEGSPEAAAAERQREALKQHWEGVGNIKEAIEHLALASFRGFSVLEKVEGDNGLVELAPVDQWHWVRDGLYGDWRYNKDSRFGTAKGEEVPDFAERFVVREVSRPINRVALVCYLRKNLSQKDWDGYVETFGIPAIFVVMPPNVPKDKEDEYEAAAEGVASDARGTLPHGSDVKTIDAGDRGGNPFKEHIAYQDEQLVLRGTGGKLTMLNDATGIGGSQGDVHQNAFDEIAEAEADEISEVLKEQVDRAFLEEKFPGQEHFAYFAIAANEETDAGQVVQDVVALGGAGYQVARDQVEERTGYELEAVEVGGGKSDPGMEKAGEAAVLERLRNRFAQEAARVVKERELLEQLMKNRVVTEQVVRAAEDDEAAEFERAARGQLEAAAAADLQGLSTVLAEALQAESPEAMAEALKSVDEEALAALEGPAGADAWEAMLTSAWLNGLADVEAETEEEQES